MSASRKNQVGQPLSNRGWQDGGVKKENAEFRMQSAEGGGRGREGLAAKEHIEHKARRSMESMLGMREMEWWSFGVLRVKRTGKQVDMGKGGRIAGKWTG